MGLPQTTTQRRPPDQPGMTMQPLGTLPRGGFTGAGVPYMTTADRPAHRSPRWVPKLRAASLGGKARREGDWPSCLVTDLHIRSGAGVQVEHRSQVLDLAAPGYAGLRPPQQGNVHPDPGLTLAPGDRISALVTTQHLGCRL
jgi:hypothetical protein